MTTQHTSSMFPRTVSVNDGRRVALATTRTATPSRTGDAAAETDEHLPAPLQFRDRDRYEIIGEEGRGGLGLVSRARDRELSRDVAVKELLQGGAAAELRFFREALITARLEHPGIVPVHEAGRWGDGTAFYTMKLVGGLSLKALLDRHPTLAGRLTLLPNVIAVADAMSYAHDRRVIHRDLKPSNIMVGDFGETIVIDWGLAKQLDDRADDVGHDGPYRAAARDDLTAAGSVLGTPAYMAPEQYQGRADQRSDIYTLGGVLYHVLTGRPPHGDDVHASSSEPPARFVRNTPADLIAIARRAMAHDPADRYATARAFADDLRRFMRRERVVARRYSLGARFALAFARHRPVALAIIAALILLSAVLTVSLLNIMHERAQAVSASEAAVISNAGALLDRDPTRAWDVIQAVTPSSATALLRARIRAAGVAERVVSLPARFDTMEISDDSGRVLISTADRELRVLDPRTGVMTELAGALTEPAVWEATGDRVDFVQQTPRLAIATVPVAGGPVTELTSIAEVPLDLEANADGTYWLAPDGTLARVAVGRPVEIVGHDVYRFLLLGSKLAICGRDGQLRVSAPGTVGSPIASCAGGGSWRASRDTFVYAADGRLHVYRDGQLHSRDVSSGDAMSMVRLSSTGVVAGIGRSGDGLIWRPEASSAQHVRLAARPTSVVTRGDLIAWTLIDGHLEVIDTASGREWSIHAHAEAPRCLGLLADDRVMTCGRQEVRFWRLSRAAPELVGQLPFTASNIVFNRDGDALLDGTDGHAYEISHDHKVAVAIHQHDALAFGVAWCSGDPCSTGWDGRVLCTDRVTGTSRVAADVHSVTRWLTAGGGHCYTAAVNGGVYDVGAPASPLYEHGHEPYRLAASPDGKYLASGDWAGDVIVYDTVHARIVATAPHAHDGLVTGIGWSNDELVTSGADGVVNVYSSALRPLRSWHLGSPIRLFAVAGETVGAGMDDGSLWMISSNGTSEQRVTTGTTFSSLAMSPSGADLAVGTNDGDVIVLRSDRHAAAERFEQGRVPCIGFQNEKVLMVCTPSGRIMQVPLDALAFQTEGDKT